MQVRQIQKRDIGGIELYYERSYVKKEQPTLIFESGYGCPSVYWDSIKDKVSEFANCFFYDRAGIGESTYDGRPQHSKQCVENLRLLLQEANIQPPYILIGHSFGGANVRLFSHTYPKEVEAVILLDSCHEDQNRVMAPLFSEEVKEGYFGQFSAQGSEASLEEFEESLEQIRNCHSLEDIPLIIASASLPSYHTEASFAAWDLFQRDLTRLSVNSKRMIIQNAGHALHIDQPEAVVQLIQNVVEELKNNPSL
ncbi:alpha/beta fold hydrolase [Priestia endophytica]|jgi:pimeloyl-ACP methyl ester carboxylesterase|uniref:Pimeloyl-ACP methyl ester carboxylesterase n=1 Tax=Priestia endophytica DSM 13796 TaxID=1121089 RepID=A0A1I6APS8_9BACI|nr:alpha/beta hydrolase [Priestia endophytica]KAB2496614.1 alpha/beta hydrolase [Priestia endophytica]KYG31024.1 2-hydroxy-6-oxononatrienedioate hydrolase [Priestia endophytica]RAS83835.1 alpha/beta hydrolase [Priestia endophytica]SFQ70622.1 Pimeloyl-ACP methyl ester carboxylesterase [Priestia endophytica DSM 13796]